MCGEKHYQEINLIKYCKYFWINYFKVTEKCEEKERQVEQECKESDRIRCDNGVQYLPDKKLYFYLPMMKEWEEQP